MSLTNTGLFCETAAPAQELTIVTDGTTSVLVKNNNSTEILGDVHNFGQATYLAADGRIVKPRPCDFEEAFLSSRSPLRSLLDRIFASAGLRLPYPDLMFEPVGDGATAVSRLQLAPTADLAAKDIESLGVAVAVAVFFGMSDLHRENLMSGTDAGGSFCFVPIDLECVFTPARTLAALSLVPGNGVVPAFAGLTDVAGWCRASCRREPNLPAVLTGAFCAACMLLISHYQEIAEILKTKCLSPVRMVLRPTDLYRALLDQGTEAIVSAGLLPAETEQLLRGDVPYFHTFVNDTDLFWMHAPGQFARISAEGYLSATGPLALPRWPGMLSHPETIQGCVSELLQFVFDDDQTIDATWSGISVRSSGRGFCIESRGTYRPV